MSRADNEATVVAMTTATRIDAVMGRFLDDGQVHPAVADLTDLLGRLEPTGATRARAVARVYLGLLHVCAGDIAAANRSLAAAHDAFEEVDPPAPEWLLAHGGVGAIAALRGEHALAEAEFDRSLSMARAQGRHRLEAIIRLVRAEVTADVDPRRAHIDARAATAAFESLDDEALGGWAERVRAIAANASGEHRAAALITERLLTRSTNPLDRGRTLVVAARARRGLGDDEAATLALHEAVDLLGGTGGCWFLVDALLLLAEAEPDHAEAWLTRAGELTTDDAADARRWATRPTLTLEVLGTQRLLVDREVLEFKSAKTLKLLFCLALAGPRGRDVDTLAELLWPDAADPSSNITTATWDARRGLRLDAWRLRRDGSRLVLDLTGARFDLEDLAVLAATPPAATAPPAQQLAWRDAMAPLQRPVLPAWGFEEWVIEADGRRASVVAGLPAVASARPGFPASAAS